MTNISGLFEKIFNLRKCITPRKLVELLAGPAICHLLFFNCHLSFKRKRPPLSRLEFERV